MVRTRGLARKSKSALKNKNARKAMVSKTDYDISEYIIMMFEISKRHNDVINSTHLQMVATS